MDEVDLARLRRDYAEAGLDEADLPAEPLDLFREWLRCAVDEIGRASCRERV